MKMTKRQKRNLYRILLAMVLFLGTLLLPLGRTGTIIGYLLCYAVIGYDILWKAVTNIFAGQVFDENFLMAIATVGAMALGEFQEGVAVMVFYQVGELFQSCAVTRSRNSISQLMDIRPDWARLLREGEEVQVEPEEVAVGDVIVIHPGERIPLDGIVLQGKTTIDTAALTGESLPRECKEGEEVISGCINLTGLLQVQVTKVYGESTVARILELVENATDKKAKTENFITKFARYYTPIVVIGAVALAILPPLFGAGSWEMWIHRALNFLVVSCPCALVISVPLSFFGGIGGASKCGILVKGSNYLELLAGLDQVVFDKTGTLTEGRFQVTKCIAHRGTTEALLEAAAYGESHSTHPIARSIVEAYGGDLHLECIQQVEEFAGYGVKVVVDGREILVGNQKLMEQYGISLAEQQEVGTIVHVAEEGQYLGAIVVEDVVKPDGAKTISELRELGVKNITMLTGDRTEVGKKVGKELGIEHIYTELLPADKVQQVEMLLNQTEGVLAFVGDGINDAPVLARADVGVAMGGLGSDAAIEAADVVLMTDEPSKLVVAVQIAKKTIRIVYQNIVFAIGVKCLVLLLSGLGYASMWAAVFADVGVAVLAILNAIRALRVPKDR